MKSLSADSHHLPRVVPSLRKRTGIEWYRGEGHSACSSLKYQHQSIFVTRLAKTGLITDIHNCSYSPFSSESQFLSHFFFNSKIKYMTLLLYVHTIPGELCTG